jgi:hypothetical protein
MLPQKLLILLVFFMLKISSICQLAHLARIAKRRGAVSQQSYPHVLWVGSYASGVFSYSGRSTG